MIKSCKKSILQFFLARFLHNFLYLARKASFLVQDLQDLVQDLASLARKTLARFAHFLQDGLYWDLTVILYTATIKLKPFMYSPSHFIIHASIHICHTATFITDHEILHRVMGIITFAVTLNMSMCMCLFVLYLSYTMTFKYLYVTCNLGLYSLQHFTHRLPS